MINICKFKYCSVKYKNTYISLKKLVIDSKQIHDCPYIFYEDCVLEMYDNSWTFRAKKRYASIFTTPLYGNGYTEKDFNEILSDPFYDLEHELSYFESFIDKSFFGLIKREFYMGYLIHKNYEDVFIESTTMPLVIVH